MKRFLLSALVLALAFCLVACKGDEPSTKDENADDKPSAASDELAFEKTADGRYYTVVGIGGLSNAEEIRIPSRYNGIAVKSIAMNAFSGNTQIKTLTVDEGVEKIGSGAFSGCTSLESVKIAKTLEKIDSSAFEGCTSLKTVTFGKGVTDVGKNAFLNCNSIESLYYEGSVSDFGKINGATWWELKYKTRYIYSASYPSSAGYFWRYGESGEALVWEDHIGSPSLKFELSDDGTYYAISGISDTSEKSIVIPKAHKGLPVAQIGAMAFIGSYMEEITIPETVTEISGSAFKWCTRLRFVNIPNGVEKIGEHAFFDCSMLEYAVVPESVKEISESAFSEETKVFYCSDKENWDNIKIGAENGSAFLSVVYFYSPSEPLSEGSFWCFGENGEIKIW